VGHVADLIDRGLKLYGAGRVREAREAFQTALDLDPRNEKARAYLLRLREAAPAGTPAPGALPPVQPAAMQPPPASSAAPARPASSVGDVVAARIAAALDLEDPGQSDWAPSPWDDGPAAPATIELDQTGGIDLEAVSEKSDLRPLVPEGAPAPLALPQPKSDVDVWLSAAKELFALGDFTGSLELIEKILQVDADHGEARDYLRQNEATLVSMYESKLAPLTRVPRLAIKPEEVMWLNLDHRAGFLLAQIDGTIDYETLFALSGLPRLDTARILANLIAEGVITS
jgi:tetratricopeptide (TPR) repeat protein